jgi:hypothetical protein
MDPEGLLIAWLLGLFRDRLETMPQRDWSKIGRLHKLGRIMLIVIFLGAIFGPIAWLVPHRSVA